MGELYIFIYFTFTGPSGMCSSGSEQIFASLILHVWQIEHRDQVDIWKLWADKSKNHRIMTSQSGLHWKRL